MLTDHLGSVVAITDTSGALVSQQRYLPFGGIRTNVTTPNSPSTDYGYTGQRNLDSDIGLMDYKARFYSPVLNRFIQPDTIVPSLYNPQMFNRFSYVGNNPLKYTDPSGNSLFHVALLLAIVGVFVVAGVVGYAESVEARAQEASAVDYACTTVDFSQKASIVKEDLNKLFNGAIDSCTGPADSCSQIVTPGYPKTGQRLLFFEAIVQTPNFLKSVFRAGGRAITYVGEKIDESIPDATPIPPYPTGTETSPSNNVVPTPIQTPPPMMPAPRPYRPIHIAI